MRLIAPLQRLLHCTDPSSQPGRCLIHCLLDYPLQCYVLLQFNKSQYDECIYTEICPIMFTDALVLLSY